MSSILNFPQANGVRIVIRQFAGRNALDKDFKFFKEYSMPAKDVYFHPFIQSDTLTVQFQSSFATNVAKLKVYGTNADQATLTVTEKDDRTTFKIFETTANISSLTGKFYLEFTGTHPDTQTYQAISEPFEIKTQCNSLLFEWFNYEPAFNIDYGTGITMYHRVNGYFDRLANTQSTDSFMDSGGQITKINHIITRERILKIARQVPDWVIEKLNLAMAHDSCKINGVLINSSNALPYDVVGEKYLWAEPSAQIQLSSGSSRLRNIHDSNERIIN